MEKSVLGLKPGDMIQDTYRIDSLLGEGGMGATFRGTNTAAGHPVAIKVMTPEFARNSRAVDLFRRESSLLRTVQNDAVVRYETTLQDKSGKLYLVMEYLSGKPLLYYLDKGARLASEDVLKLAERLCSGLAAIHALGIVHRDVAPDNILVPDEDVSQAKFIDFGLASDSVGTDKSILGSDFAGKLRYCAPEQLGLFDNRITPATDIYALGLVLMRCAGLTVPGDGKGWAAIDDRREDIKIRDDRVSRNLRGVLEAFLRADPSLRPADPLALVRKALAAEKAGAQRTDGPKDRPPAPDARDSKPDTGGRASTVVALIAGLVIVAGGAAWFFLMGPGASTTSGASTKQAALAQDAAQSNDPLAEAENLIAASGAENLNAAFGALMALSGDDSQSTDIRIRANIMIAEMYDPATHDTARSPFPRANPAAAKRHYQRAADLGSETAAQALSRLAD
ncbi:MAG TPA: serine/threonine-protein kinase [Roseovarius sp.]|nr:serine/threonine-protein kinase [Roseovarius sp.]